MTERYITPSKITAWLDCAHFLALKHQVEDGLREAPTSGMGSFARLLADKGLQHETACLDEYERQGMSILRVSEREKREAFRDWVARVGHPFDQGWDVIYQMPFAHGGIRGIADFLVRVVDDAGVDRYEPVDAKPGHVLQLCFYADAIEASTGRRPARMHLWLGSGVQETLAVEAFGAYWRRLRGQRAGAKLAAEKPELNGDTGFRVLEVDSSSMSELLRTPDELVQGELALYTSSVKSDRSSEDLLFSVLVEWGLELDLPIETELIDGREVHSVDGDAVIACFADSISANVIAAIAALQPLRAVFLNAGFASDADRINAEQIFVERSPSTDMKTI